MLTRAMWLQTKLGETMTERKARTWLPSPWLSLFLLLVWLLLNNSLSAGHLVLGSLFALAIPLFTARYSAEQPKLVKPIIALKLLLVVLWDILLANMQVARWLLGSPKRLTPAFIKVPLDLTEPLPITILAATVSLTPGTVSAEIIKSPSFATAGSSPAWLLIHALHVDDEAQLIAAIKQRYERPIKEMFQC